jgi:hypothetical protein
MLTALAYSSMDKTSGLTADEVYSDAVVQAFAGLEQNTYHYGIQNRPLMQIMAQRGPDYLHAITSSEAEVLKANADYASTLVSLPLLHSLFLRSLLQTKVYAK